jgi:hypothetical protein
MRECLLEFAILKVEPNVEFPLTPSYHLTLVFSNFCRNI